MRRAVLLCCILLSVFWSFSQIDSMQNNYFQVGVSSGALLPQFNGISETVEVSYVGKLFRYTVGFDFIRFDYINLKKIGHKGFAGSMNNMFFLFDYYNRIKKIEFGAGIGGFIGYGRTDHHSYESKAVECATCSQSNSDITVYKKGMLSGFKLRTNTFYQLSEKWKIGINANWNINQIDWEYFQAQSFFDVQLGAKYTF